MMQLAAQQTGDVGALNDREQVIFDLVATGMTNRQIAAQVALAEKTVKNYVTGILRKLEMRGREEIVRYAGTLN